MKLRLFLAALLVAASLISFPLMSLFADSQKEAVQVYERVFVGTPEEAEGLSMDIRATLDDNIFWNINYKGGSDPETSARFTYSSTKERYAANYSRGYISAYTDIYFGYTDRYDYIISEQEDFISGMPIKPARELAAKTPANSVRTETVYLKDYYDFFPVMFYTTRYGTDEEIPNLDENDSIALSQYFRIPVPDDFQVTVTADRRGNGQEVRLECEPVEVEDRYGNSTPVYPAYECHSVVSNGKLIFYIYFGGFDTSFIKNGYGIYTMDFTGAQYEHGIADTLTTAIPLDPADTICDLSLREDSNTLNVLYYSSEGRLSLSVYSLSDMSLIQDLDLSSPAEKIVTYNSMYDVEVSYINDSFFWNDEHGLLVVSDCQISYAEPQPDGRYEIKVTAPVPEEQAYLTYYLAYPVQFTYDGSRLAIGAYRSYSPVSWVTAVADNSGICFYADYCTNLNSPLLPVDGEVTRYSNFDYSVLFPDKDPFYIHLD